MSNLHYLLHLVSATSESDSSRDGPPSMKVAHVTAESGVEVPIEVKIEPEHIVKLPDDLSTPVLDIINEIKKAAEHSSGKVKFFTENVNNMFLK